MSRLVLTRRLLGLGVGVSLFLGAGTGLAQASAAGILPPKNPAANCTRGSLDISGIEYCRALEGVGGVKLPSNWDSLTTVQQGFVLIDLERVNRGLAPIVGLSPSLNQLASTAAANHTDPSFPSGGYSGGAIWAEAPSILAADYMWMYDDGPNGSNADCASAGDAGCWGHREIMLWNRTHGTLVAGGGYSGGGTGSFAYVVLSGYSTANLTFTWSGELKYFATKPGAEPIGKSAAAAIRRHKKVRRKRHKHRRVIASSNGITISIG